MIRGSKMLLVYCIVVLAVVTANGATILLAARFRCDVLEREHSFVGPVLVGQELAERVGIIDCRRIQRLEAVGLELAPEGVEQLPRRADFARGNVE